MAKKDKEVFRDKKASKEQRIRTKKHRLLLLLFLLFILTLIFHHRVPQIIWLTKRAECLQCHVELIAKLNYPYIHLPFLNKTCLSCHKPHTKRRIKSSTEKLENVCGRLFSTRIPFAAFWRMFYTLIFGPPARKKIASTKFEKSELVIALKKLCFQCHQKVSLEFKKIDQHQPFAKANCLSCHDPHASQFRSITSAEEHDLCLTCHNILKELAKEYTHPPFEARDCLSCHEPHASDYFNLKRANERILCFSCHQRIADLTHLSVQHRPFEEGCTTCHQAHASSIATLLNQNMPPLCYKCHLEIKKEFAKKSQHPISTNFPCTECHRPHASNYLDLLFAFGNEVCYRCHPRIRAAYEVTAHSQIRPQAIGRITGSCLNCHLAHGSDFTPLLVLDELTLCRRCHPVMFPPKNHPVGYDLVDRRTGSSLTCTSTCHWIHYWPTDALLRWVPDELCLICHPEVGISM